MPKKTCREGEVCAFVQKLWDILQNQEFSNILLWNTCGKTFTIINVTLLERTILPVYFRHAKLKSFVRQLNMYDFKKSQRDKELLVFYNHHFKREEQGKLHLIRRKISKRSQLPDPQERAEFQFLENEGSNDDWEGESASNLVVSRNMSRECQQSNNRGPQIKSYCRLVDDGQNLIPFISPFSYTSIKSARLVSPQESEIKSLTELQFMKNGSTSVEDGWAFGFTSCQYFI